MICEPLLQTNAGEGLLTTAERQELIRLRRQLRQVTMERDILAKATAWFANKGNGIDK